MTAELAWDHATTDIPETGLASDRIAAPDELDGLARALDLIACRGLAAHYAIAPAGMGRYRLTGTLRAEVSQACVVTLEPVSGTIEEAFEQAFWPQEDMPAPRSGEVNLDEAPDPEPIVAGQIPVGRVVFECLAAALDPYPRAAGATLDRLAAAPREGVGRAGESPFAVLASIKTKG